MSRHDPVVVNTRGEEFQMWRVDGRAICANCHKAYNTHPLARDILDWQGEPFVYSSCEPGVVLKL